MNWMEHVSMFHPIEAKFRLLGRLIQDLGSEQVFEVLVGTSVALAQRIVVIQASAEGGNHVVRIEGGAVGELDALLEGAGPFGGVGIASAGLSQIGLGIRGTPVKGVQLAEDLVTDTEGAAVGLIRTEQGDGLAIL